MIGGFTMKHKLKDPGSAITHLIGMILAAIVSIPLIIRTEFDDYTDQPYVSIFGDYV